MKLNKTVLSSFFFICFFTLIFAGCGGGYEDVFKKFSPVKAKASYKPTEEFNDIMVPKDLKVNEKFSYMVETPGFLGGILVYEGKVTRNSLMEFFKTSMVNDNWTMLTSLKSPVGNSIMLFKKVNRWCVINISEDRFKTRAEIAVAPTNSGSGAVKNGGIIIESGSGEITEEPLQ
ncbi:MAG: hypothetical protein JRJ44_00525 [Deltaproteobacteria bacterium]|nr:hypothetical protein [Deltaproteobacteria bacterium]